MGASNAETTAGGINRTSLFRARFARPNSSCCARFAQRYSPLRPYWESLLLARKLVLILASTTQFITDPLAQALIGTATNLAYLVLFEVKRP